MSVCAKNCSIVRVSFPFGASVGVLLTAALDGEMTNDGVFVVGVPTPIGEIMIGCRTVGLDGIAPLPVGGVVVGGGRVTSLGGRVVAETIRIGGKVTGCKSKLNGGVVEIGRNGIGGKVTGTPP